MRHTTLNAHSLGRGNDERGESERGESERGTWTIAQLINGVAFAMLSGPSSSGPPYP